MSEQKVFMIANLRINDKDTYQAYEKGFFPILKKYDGEFVTYDDSVETFEGSSPLEGRAIIFSFPSPEKARKWFNDPEYQELAKNRRTAAELKNLSMIKSLPARK
tara:strand:+ start:281 stop:595 length:315 start_codon:yes stop_codon:yes gene_type:complete